MDLMMMVNMTSGMLDRISCRLDASGRIRSGRRLTGLLGLLCINDRIRVRGGLVAWVTDVWPVVVCHAKMIPSELEVGAGQTELFASVVIVQDEA